MNRPNILFITSDALRFDALNCNGNALAVSPNIDKLASEGMRFERAYCSQPICMPCRASMMTGRYPSAHGVWQNGIPFEAETPTLSTLFNDAGYFTALYGKAHFKPWRNSLELKESHTYPEHPGTDPYYGFQDVRICDHTTGDAYAQWVQKYFPQHAELALNPGLEKPEDTGLAWKSTLPREATKSQYIADVTIDALREKRGKPFMIWCSIIDPHHPFNPPAPHCDVFDEAEFLEPPHLDGPSPKLPTSYHDWKKRLKKLIHPADLALTDWQNIRRMYQGKAHHVDYQVGRILDALREENLEEETIIVFCSDHGMMLGDFGLLQVGEYSQNPLVHIPMIWRVPGAAASVTNSLTSTVDILPTLLDFAGLEIPLGLQGISLRPLLEGNQMPLREQLIIENRWGQKPVEGFNTLVTERYKLSLYTNGIEGELYDLENDPREENNLFGNAEVREIQRQLTNQFAVEMLRHQDPLPRRIASW